MTEQTQPFKWDKRFLKEAHAKADWSKDPSTKVGAIAVIDRRIVATGYNGFPERTNDDPAIYEDRDRKYLRTVHAEANLVCQAAKYGVSLEGATVYTTFHPCAWCAGLLINAGVDAVVYDSSLPIPDRWEANMEEASDMMVEADLTISSYRFSDASDAGF